MNELANLILGSSLEETIAKVVVFLAIGEFIAGLFSLIGRLKV